MHLFVRRFRIGPKAALCALPAVLAFQLLPAGALACSSVGACVLGQNSGPGYGLQGIAFSSDGVFGNTSFKSTSASNAKAGVYGVDDTSKTKFNFGVFGTSTAGVGVAGVSKSNYAVTGTSSTSSGIAGYTLANSTSASNGKTGVAGLDASTNQNTYNSGVYGYSAYANGVHAKSLSGNGLYAESANGNGVSAFGPTAVLALTPGDESNGFGYVAIDADAFAVEGTGLRVSGGAFGITAGIDGTESILPATAISGETGPAGTEGENTAIAGNAVDGAAANFNATGQGFGVIAGTDTGVAAEVGADNGLPLSVFGTGTTLITAANASKDVMSLDGSGNLVLAGTLKQSGTPLVAVQRADGRQAMAYGARTTEATLEDAGQAMLTGGIARVALDPAFAATLDVQHPYLVFLTAEGDNAGLYISQKSAAGFTIREHGGGRSTLAVDYRILAKPLGERYARLPLAAPLFSHDSQAARQWATIRKRNAIELQRQRRVWATRSAKRASGHPQHA